MLLPLLLLLECGPNRIGPRGLRLGRMEECGCYDKMRRFLKSRGEDDFLGPWDEIEDRSRQRR